MDVPEDVRIKMELASKNKGAHLSMYVPIIPLPESQPDLSGEAFSPLPKHSFQWWLLKRLHSIEVGLSRRKTIAPVEGIAGGYVVKDTP